MKIRTITFQRTNNCGAALQAYALMEFLKKYYDDVKIVDYCPEWVQSSGITFLNLICNFSFKSFLLYPFAYVRNRRFKDFVKNYCDMTSRVCSSQEISEKIQCDIFITGSDQVWNPEITKGAEDGYLLSFPTRAKKIAYAASCGNDELPESLLCSISKAISDYKAVSVREKNLRDALMAQHYSKSVIPVWDPVFLLERRDYLRIAKLPKEKNFLLIYAMHDSIELRKIAKIVADQYELEIIDISKIRKIWPADKVKYGVGPSEFLGFFANASFVVTNSFHGTAFSILFRKNFYVMDAEHRTSRLISLLEDVGLMGRFVQNANCLKKVEQIDYSMYEEAITSYSQKGRDFLISNCSF